MNRSESAYLNSIGRIPMLTPSEEVHLSRLIQAGLDPNATPLQQRRGIRARNRMVAANLRLAVSLAGAVQRRCSSMDIRDLVQEAAIGLARAAEKFDPKRGYKFSTYAYPWINQALTRGIAAKDRMVYVPPHVGNTLYRMRKAAEQASKDGRTITSEDAAVAADVRSHDCWRAALRVDSVRSLNDLINRTDNTQLVDLIAYETSEPDICEELSFDRERFDAALASLPERWELIVRSVYGIGRPIVSQKQLGKQLGISHQAVNYVLVRAYKRLRDQLDPPRQQPDDTPPSDWPDHRPDPVPAVRLARATTGQPTGATAVAA